MSKEWDAVVRFNQEILGIEPRVPHLQKIDEARLSHAQLTEEADEFLEATEQCDYIGAIDGVIDSMVFSIGILYKLGVTRAQYGEIFTAVMEANMSKQIGVKKGREGFDAADAIKPEDFVSPEDRIAQILGASCDD